MTVSLVPSTAKISLSIISFSFGSLFCFMNKQQVTASRAAITRTPAPIPTPSISVWLQKKTHFDLDDWLSMDTSFSMKTIERPAACKNTSVFDKMSVALRQDNGRRYDEVTEYKVRWRHDVQKQHMQTWCQLIWQCIIQTPGLLSAKRSTASYK